MKRTAFALALWMLVFPLVLQAETFGPGKHIVNGLIITVPAGSTITIEVPTSVVNLEVPENPTKPPVDPPPNKTLQAKVKTWTESVDEIEVASIIAEGYREVAKRIDAKEVTTKQQAVDAMEMYLSNILRPRITKKLDEWKWWEEKVNAELSALQDAGSLNGLTELSAAYKTIVLGMEDAGAAALNLPLIIELITAILSKDYAKIIDIILRMIQNRSTATIIPKIIPNNIQHVNFARDLI